MMNNPGGSIRAVMQQQQQQQQQQRSMQENVEMDSDTTSSHGGCSTSGMLQGPYNTEPSVVPFHGLMFDIASREQAIEIYTLTLDVLAEAAGAIDLSVDVWTTTGTFQASYFNESAWTHIVHAETTKMRRNPMTSSHGAVIPAYAFDTIAMNPRERRAFYVRMNGSYLDYSVDAFVQDVEYTAKTNELAIYPGFGVDMAKGGDGTIEVFPQTLERPLRPIFAGAIHYQSSCTSGSRSTVTTPITYVVLMDQAITTALFQQISIAMDATIDTAMRNDKVLVAYQQDFDLQSLQGETKTKEVPFLSDCPSGWDRCFSMETTALVQHDMQLLADDIQFRLYQYWEDLVKAIQTSFPNTKVNYVGLTLAATLYDITLYGVPHNVPMDEIQLAYFVQETKRLLNQKLQNDESEQTRVLMMDVLDQNSLTRRQLKQHHQQQLVLDQQQDHRYLQSPMGTIKIHGRMSGLQLAERDWHDFTKTLENVLYSNGVEYAMDLSFNVNYVKGEMGEQKRYQYFEAISNVKSVVQSDLALMPTTAPTISADADRSNLDKGLELGKEAASSVDNHVWMTVGICVAGLVVLPLLWYLFNQWSRQTKEQREKQKKLPGRKRDRNKKQYKDDGKEQPKESATQRQSQQESSSTSPSPPLPPPPLSPPPPPPPPPPPRIVPPMNPSQAPQTPITLQTLDTSNSRTSDRHNNKYSSRESSSHERRSSRDESGSINSNYHRRRSSSRDGSAHSHDYRRSSSRDRSGYERSDGSSSHRRRSSSRDESGHERTSSRRCDSGSHHKRSGSTGSGSSHHRRSHSGSSSNGSHHHHHREYDRRSRHPENPHREETSSPQSNDSGRVQQLFVSSAINKQHPNDLRLSQSLHSSTGHPHEPSMFRFTRSAGNGGGEHNHGDVTCSTASRERSLSADCLPLPSQVDHRSRSNGSSYDIHDDDLRHSRRSSRSSSSDNRHQHSTSGRHGNDNSRHRSSSLSSSHHSLGDSSNRSSSRDQDGSSRYPPRRDPVRRTKSFEGFPSRPTPISTSKDGVDPDGRPRRKSMNDDQISQSLSSSQRRGGRKDHHHGSPSCSSSQSHHSRLESGSHRGQEPSGYRPELRDPYGTGKYTKQRDLR